MKRIHETGRGVLVLMHLAPPADRVVRGFLQDFAATDKPVVLAQADALRDLGTGCQILLDLGLAKLELLSNSSRPIVGIEAYGLEIVAHRSLG